MGRRDGIETLSTALEVLPDPYKLAAQTMLQVCSYAGTGDVLIVQELLHICSEPSLDGLNSPTQSAETLAQAASNSRIIHDDSFSNLKKNARSEFATASSSFDKLRNQYKYVLPIKQSHSFLISQSTSHSHRALANGRVCQLSFSNSSFLSFSYV